MTCVVDRKCSLGLYFPFGRVATQNTVEVDSISHWSLLDGTRNLEQSEGTLVRTNLWGVGECCVVVKQRVRNLCLVPIQ